MLCTSQRINVYLLYWIYFNFVGIPNGSCFVGLYQLKISIIQPIAQWLFCNMYITELNLTRHLHIESRPGVLRILSEFFITRKCMNYSWWCHDIKMTSTFLWEGNPPMTSTFLLQRTSNVELWWFICCQPEYNVKQTVELFMIWDTLMLIWHHCDEFTKVWYTRWWYYGLNNSLPVSITVQLSFGIFLHELTLVLVNTQQHF